MIQRAAMVLEIQTFVLAFAGRLWYYIYNRFQTQSLGKSFPHFGNIIYLPGEPLRWGVMPAAGRYTKGGWCYGYIW